MTNEPEEWVDNPVPIQFLWTRIEFVEPTPTELILKISSSIFKRSPPNIDVIPLIVIELSILVASFESVVVIEVATIGDWITLSIEISALEFWFLAINPWDDPIPTLVKSRVTGNAARASSALPASLILRSSILTAYTVDGTLSVVPTPGIDVDAIPMETKVTQD